MKTLIAFVLGLCLFVSAGRAQTQQPPTNRLSNLVQTQSDTAWQLVNFGSTTNVYSIDFLNADTGWVAGGAGLFMTTDSGNTWLPWGPAGSYRKVQFLNSKIGWAMGSLSSSLIFLTTNGGVDWTTINLGYAPKDVYFLNADTGIACRGGNQSRTTDGGVHWIDSSNDAYNGLYKIMVFDQSHMLMVGGPTLWQPQPPYTLYSEFQYSSNAGLTWTRAKFELAHTQLNTGSAFNSSLAIVAGDSLIGRTLDGGKSWTFLNEPNIWFFGSCITSINDWYVVGASSTSGATAILVSTDGGVNWTPQNCPSIGTLFDIQFSTPQIGWAGSVDGGLLRTTTGGFASAGQLQQTKQNLAVQLFPNPAQRQVQFQYDLPQTETVTLRVYNTTGQLILTPLSNSVQNPGMQQIGLQTGSLNAGDYVFLLQSQDYLQSGRFAVVK
jgi:photosystem II stability/assembly factor-like uncharacterized protein